MASWWVVWATGGAGKRAGRCAGKRVGCPSHQCPPHFPAMAAMGAILGTLEMGPLGVLPGLVLGSPPDICQEGGGASWKEGSGVHPWGGSPHHLLSALVPQLCCHGGVPLPEGDFLDLSGQSPWIFCHLWLEVQLFLYIRCQPVCFYLRLDCKLFSFSPRGSQTGLGSSSLEMFQVGRRGWLDPLLPSGAGWEREGSSSCAWPCRDGCCAHTGWLLLLGLLSTC